MDSSLEPLLKGNTGRNTRGILRLTILCLIAGAAVSSRLFSVIRKCLPSHIADTAASIANQEREYSLDVLQWDISGSMGPFETAC